MSHLCLKSEPHYTPQRICALTLCFLLIASSACAQAGGKDYFPLSAGSRWTYTGTFRHGNGRVVAMRAVARVEGKIIIRGKEYFKYVITPEFVGAPDLPKLSERVRYYRIGKDGVYLLPSSNVDGPELLELSLPARPGVRWLDGNAEARAEGAGTVKTGGRAYADCLKVSYKSADGQAGTQYYLAPGVGMIKGSFAEGGESGTVMELTLVEYKR